MSLRVWLPLNGDLKNQGLDELLFNNYNVTLNDSGKIGKCALFDGASSYIQFTNWTINNNPQLSICFWVNSNSSTLAGVFTCRKSTVHQISLTTFGLSFRDTNHSSIKQLYFTQPTVGVWSHYALIYDNGNWIIYKDGVEILNVTYSEATLNVINDIRIGRYLSSSNDVYFDGKLNDFRIYDHCLSPAEVKEISRGLVLHYKLDHLPINNLIPFNLTTDNYTVYDYGNRTSGHISNNIYHVDGYQSTGAADSSFRITSNSYLTLTANKDYYLSFYCKAKSDGNLYFTQSNYPQTGLIDDLNNKYHAVNAVTIGTDYDGWVTIKVHTGSSTQYKIILGFDTPNIYGIGSYIEFSKIILTTSLPDLESTYFDNTILDSSGYNNNGTITGELSLNSESPRYSQNIIFNTTSSHIRIDDLPSTLANDFSVSWWSKLSTYSQKMPWCSANGNRLNFYNGLYWNTYNGASNPIRKPGTTTIIATPSANVWHHFVMTGDGTTCKFYMDGELYGIAKTYQGLTATSILLNGSADNASTYHLAGAEMSDFRIYATALSEEDVRQLYEVSGKIDNIGNFHSYKFEEYNIGRELLVVKRFCYPYYTISGNWNNFSSEGMEFNSSINSAGTEYIEINPEGHEYIYDFTISVSDGNQFYIGFERYDENKTARGNNACTYVYSNKPGSDLVKRRYTGTVNLSTDGVNPCKYIRLRILNGWSGSDSDSTKLATVHRWSLREIPTSTDSKTKLLKQGVLKTDMLREGNTRTKIEKNLVTYVNELIEI